MKKILVIAIISTYACIGSDKNIKYTQLTVLDTTYSKCMVEYQDNLINGQIECFDDEQIVFKGTAIDNILEGGFYTYYTNGTLRSKGTYKESKYILDYYQYYKDSSLYKFTHYDSSSFDAIYGLIFSNEGSMTHSFAKFLLKSDSLEHRVNELSEFRIELLHTLFDSTVIGVRLESSDKFRIGQVDMFIPNGSSFFIEPLDTGWIDIKGRVSDIGVVGDNFEMGAEQPFSIRIHVE